MKTIKAKIHRLPTEDASQVVRRKDDGLLNNLGRPTKTSLDEWTNQHLYITTDEEIKEGDWCYQTVINKVIQARTDYYKDFRFRKIIATTDPKLKVITGMVGSGTGEPLPQIPQSFIEEYCKSGGIDEVLVECYDEVSCKKCNQPVEICDNSPRCEGDYVVINTIKLNPDNCIIIHPVETDFKLNRNKLLKLVHDVGGAVTKEDSTGFDLDKWIEENL